MNARDHLDRWERRLEAALDSLAERSATIHSVHRTGPPATDCLRAAVRDTGRPIPKAIAYLVEEGALHGSWQLRDEDVESLPDSTRDVSWGGLDLSVAEVVAAETSRLNWVSECFQDRQNSYDIVWHDKFAFHTVANGDCLAISDGTGPNPVYYLSHDDGEGHGVVLAPSLIEFLDTWSQIGFAGPEDWLLLPFLNPDSPTLDVQSTVAREWRTALGLDAIDTE